MSWRRCSPSNADDAAPPLSALARGRDEVRAATDDRQDAAAVRPYPPSGVACRAGVEDERRPSARPLEPLDRRRRVRGSSG